MISFIVSTGLPRCQKLKKMVQNLSRICDNKAWQQDLDLDNDKFLSGLQDYLIIKSKPQMFV